MNPWLKRWDRVRLGLTILQFFSASVVLAQVPPNQSGSLPALYAQREAEASASVRAKLVTLRQRAGREDWTFRVGYTKPLDLPVELLTGALQPENLAELALAQNVRANEVLKNTQFALRIEGTQRNACYSTASAFDWRQHGGETPIEDQKTCGSCWAFATAAAFESNYRINSGKTIDVSEQQILDCNVKWSCSGGWWAFDYIKSNGGITSAADYPYTAKKGPCQSKPKRYLEDTWGFVRNNGSTPTADEMKAALCSHGPIVVAVRATDAFVAYVDGVFNEHDAKCSGTKDGSCINHVVAITGWDQPTKSWIIKNSWGGGWGMNGYMRISSDSNNIGFMAAWIETLPQLPPPSKNKPKNQK